MKRTKILTLVCIGLTLAALACGPLGGGAQTTSTDKATPAAGGVGAGTSPTKPPATGGGGEASPTKPASPEGDLSLSSLTEGLKDLESYKANMFIKFDGKDDQGQPVNGTMEMQEEFTKEPQAQRITVKTSGLSEDKAGTMEMITIGEASYLVLQDAEGKKTCISTSASDSKPSQSLFSPDAMGGISGAKYVGTETVNGVQAKHYTWKEGSGLTGLGFTKANGETWVAVDGGYVVKYTAQATGKGALFGASNNEGTVAIEYNLAEVNGSFKIEPPSGCESPATDIPIMADAKDKSMFGEMVTYTSASAFADVVQFYKDEMPKNGWAASGEPVESEGYAMLEYTKDNRKAQVMISEDKDKKIINVMISTSEE